jgi:hypothetical protein
MSTPTKERPILFTGAMVRAILAGSKTQTRRILKLPPMQPWQHRSKGWYFLPECNHSSENTNNFVAGFSDGTGTIINIKCPYGTPAFVPFNRPADRLWVRETWSVSSAHDSLSPKDIPSSAKVEYAADGSSGYIFGKGRPSIFMPRWASRIALEIIAIKVERLQDISEADARAEGVTPTAFERLNDNWGGVLYRKLWESIHGPGSWDANPWLWVIQFQRIQQP